MALGKMDTQISRILEISKSYYIDGLSQTQIANKLNLSRPTVSRALQSAKEDGIVEIKINDPLNDMNKLSEELKNKFNLKHVIISSDTNNNEEIIIKELGYLASSFTESTVKGGDIIGVSWGRTIAALANSLHYSQHNNVSIVHLKGSVTNSTIDNYSSEITGQFSKNFHTQVKILPLPVIFDSASTKEIVLKDHFISDIITEGYRSNIALFTVGTVRTNAMLFNLGYLDKTKIAYLQKKAVGDIMSHFIDNRGNIVDKELDARTVSIPLNELRKKETSILVAGGIAKLKPIHAALIGKYANVLITDQNVAKALLNL